ncbi:MAG TPA: glycosyltransferase family 2 protein [Candidatus Choladousia intestinavium]|uniref:Glycosyltransferase family 2 protein n=1 Tax=Candidatus Choladousia intestinavium TaxID=2840727 RepID=A0A9D1AG15_9FIRM|nr:glycosyltransferase family 2 protein [Candidatus Choladousia intestinavium]
MKRISIIVPCLNEQEALLIYYRKTSEIMEGMKEAEFEFIFIDDGSSDRTLDLLRQFKERDRRCRYLSFSRNFGKEAAIYAGFQYARGDYITVMDADLQDPPELIPQMYEELEGGQYDCVAARRIDRKGEKPLRSFLSSMFYKVADRISKIQVMEGARDFRMMTRRMADAVLEMSEYNRFSKGIFGWVGFQTKWLEYRNAERVAGETKWPLPKLLKYSLDGILGFSTLPLALSSYGGIFFCGAAFLTVCFLVIRYLIFHDPVQGWTTLMCAIFFIGGVQLLCVGILGQYLARTYMEVKRRPVYILKENSDEEYAQKERERDERKTDTAAVSSDFCGDCGNILSFTEHAGNHCRFKD